MKLPVLTDLESLLQRLAQQEREVMRRLAQLEAQIRKFEDSERPAYEDWIRLELGPGLMTLEELYERIHEKRLLAHKINELVQTEELHPREALYVALGKGKGFEEQPPQSQPHESSKKGQAKQGWDAEEIEARRRAKLEAKRAARKENKKKRQSTPTEVENADHLSHGRRNSLVSLYRFLARKLHPDSPTAVKGLAPGRVLKLWLEVQSAYNQNNVERLQSIAAWIGAEDAEGVDFPSQTAGERVDKIRALRKSCARLEQKLSQLKIHPAWEFQSVSGPFKRKLRQKAARELDEETARTQEVLDALDDFLDSIGPARPPRGKRR